MPEQCHNPHISYQHKPQRSTKTKFYLWLGSLKYVSYSCYYELQIFCNPGYKSTVKDITCNQTCLDLQKAFHLTFRNTVYTLQSQTSFSVFVGPILTIKEA